MKLADVEELVALPDLEVPSIEIFGAREHNLKSIKETINNAKSSIPVAEPKKEAAVDVKEKTQGKTVQEIDREKLEEKFSKDKKETLN